MLGAAALGTGRVRWAAVQGDIHLEIGVEAAVGTVQVCRAVERLVAVSKWKPGGPKIPIVWDTGQGAPGRGRPCYAQRRPSGPPRRRLAARPHDAPVERPRPSGQAEHRREQSPSPGRPRR
ncbi:hypothetical protein GCM10010282_31260 [Streptomyces roseolus]|nr:hypothetical protein GCM10010282_31260 [Streptomyces roseolus]